MTLAVAVLVLLAVLVLSRRANELCALRLDDGGARLLRGAAPPTLVHEVSDIARRNGLRGVTLRVVSEGGVPRLLPARGVPEGTLQMLRNAVGLYPLVRFRKP